MTKIYLHLDKKEFKNSEKEANKSSIDNDPNNESSKEELLYEDMKIDNENIEYEDGQIHIYGDLAWRGKNLGFIDLEFKPDAEIIASIIEAHVKMLNKVKTMLEATK